MHAHSTSQTGRNAASLLLITSSTIKVEELKCRRFGRTLTYFCVPAELADGGAGLICSGNIPVDREYLESAGNAVLDYHNPWDAVEAFKPAIRAAKSRGALFLAQVGAGILTVLNKH